MRTRLRFDLVKLGILPPLVMTWRDARQLSKLAGKAMKSCDASGEFLMDELGRAVVVADHEIAPSVVTMGARVTYRDDRGGTGRVRLVYPGSRDINRGDVSVLSPLGTALIGLAEGQSMAWRGPNGEWSFLTVIRVDQSEIGPEPRTPSPKKSCQISSVAQQAS